MALSLDYHFDASSYTLVLQLDDADSSWESGKCGDLVIDIAGSGCCNADIKLNKDNHDTTDVEELFCRLQPGDCVISTSSCRHRTEAPSVGSRWTVVAFYGYA